jgi:hypothetical protein
LLDEEDDTVVGDIELPVELLFEGHSRNPNGNVGDVEPAVGSLMLEVLGKAADAIAINAEAAV